MIDSTPQAATPKRDPAAPAQGVGLGLRAAFADELIERDPVEVRWLEIHPENYIARGGRFASVLRQARDQWRTIPHGLTLGFGTTQGYERRYLEQLAAFLREIDAPWYSDHLCFVGAEGAHAHDLLPLPRTAESVSNAVDRIHELRDAIELPVAFENVSYYAETEYSVMSDLEFILEVLERADAQMLLDVNNVYVNAQNLGFDPEPFLAQIPAQRVVQIHVAGHLTRSDGLIIDTHAEPVCDGVYGLLESTLRRIGPVPVLLERDGNYPDLDVLLAEVRALGAIYDRAMEQRV